MATQAIAQFASSVSSALVVDAVDAIPLAALAAISFGLICLSRNDSVNSVASGVKTSDVHYNDKVLVFLVFYLLSSFHTYG